MTLLSRSIPNTTGFSWRSLWSAGQSRPVGIVPLAEFFSVPAQFVALGSESLAVGSSTSAIWSGVEIPSAPEGLSGFVESSSGFSPSACSRGRCLSVEGQVLGRCEICSWIESPIGGTSATGERAGVGIAGAEHLHNRPE